MITEDYFKIGNIYRFKLFELNSPKSFCWSIGELIQISDHEYIFADLFDSTKDFSYARKTRIVNHATMTFSAKDGINIFNLGELDLDNDYEEFLV